MRSIPRLLTLLLLASALLPVFGRRMLPRPDADAFVRKLIADEMKRSDDPLFQCLENGGRYPAEWGRRK